MGWQLSDTCAALSGIYTAGFIWKQDYWYIRWVEFKRTITYFWILVDSFAFGVLLYKCYAGQTIIDCSVYDAQRVLQNEKGIIWCHEYDYRLIIKENIQHHHCYIDSHPKLETISKCWPVYKKIYGHLLINLDQFHFFSQERVCHPVYKFWGSNLSYNFHRICEGIRFKHNKAGALTLHYLDTLLQRPQKEKEQFFSDLPAVLGNRLNWNYRRVTNFMVGFDRFLLL